MTTVLEHTYRVRVSAYQTTHPYFDNWLWRYELTMDGVKVRTGSQHRTQARALAAAERAYRRVSEQAQ